MAVVQPCAGRGGQPATWPFGLGAVPVAWKAPRCRAPGPGTQQGQGDTVTPVRTASRRSRMSPDFETDAATPAAAIALRISVLSNAESATKRAASATTPHLVRCSHPAPSGMLTSRATASGCHQRSSATPSSTPDAKSPLQASSP